MPMVAFVPAACWNVAAVATVSLAADSVPALLMVYVAVCVPSPSTSAPALVLVPPVWLNVL